MCNIALKFKLMYILIKIKKMADVLIVGPKERTEMVNSVNV